MLLHAQPARARRSKHSLLHRPRKSAQHAKILTANDMKRKNDTKLAAVLRDRVNKIQEMKAWFIRHSHKEIEPHPVPEAS